MAEENKALDQDQAVDQVAGQVSDQVADQAVGQAPAEKPALLDLLKEAIQIGIVVEDIDKAVDGMRFVFGLEPTFKKVMPYPWVRYRGELHDVQAHVASYDHFGLQLEFMQPLGTDKSAWGDHLENYTLPGYSIHHVRFSDVEDNDVVTALLAEKGIEVYMEGASVVSPKGKFTYYDTREWLGFVIEVVTKRQ